MDTSILTGSLKDMVDALAAYGLENNIPVYHYGPHNQTGSYIEWAEDGAPESEWADDEMQQQALSGTVDFYTKVEYDKSFKKIQAILNKSGLSWKLNSIQHETDTRYIHYEWVWEVEEWQ